jgi:hypothetical protein
MRTAGVLAGAVAIIALLSQSALPHSWYDWECCSDRDCGPINYVPVPLPNGSFQLPTGEIVPKERVKWSRDEHYHLCRFPPDGFIFCLYVPPQGS